MRLPLPTGEPDFSRYFALSLPQVSPTTLHHGYCSSSIPISDDETAAALRTRPLHIWLSGDRPTTNRSLRGAGAPPAARKARKKKGNAKKRRKKKKKRKGTGEETWRSAGRRCTRGERVPQCRPRGGTSLSRLPPKGICLLLLPRDLRARHVAALPPTRRAMGCLLLRCRIYDVWGRIGVL